ncbi:MAG: hypothetical protein AAGB26_16210 [Planctomycetota bacterium]
MRFAKQIRENARVISRLHGRIHATFAHRDEGESQYDEWKTACADFHAHYDSLAFLGGVREARERLRSGENDAIDYALDFLEVRPYFFRSGYMYKDFMRVLRNCPLSPSQRKRYERLHAAYTQFREQQRESAG